MKQLAIISGKGGTGKTSITAAFASLTKGRAVYADCDVDASDLHLILKPRVIKTMKFHGLKTAVMDKEKCIGCRRCYENCRFNAIDDELNIIEERCEGCGVCVYVCPSRAITLTDRDSGLLYISETRFGPMVHAKLSTAEESSGKLVSMVRENAKNLAEEKNKGLIIIDGPPGIGCPVISTITGVDLVLVVVEPTVSAIHDMSRVIDVSKHFSIPSVVCINKYSLNEEKTSEIIEYCRSNDIEVVGMLPYDTVVIESMVQEKTVIEYPNTVFSDKIRLMWRDVEDKLFNGVREVEG
ncbi:MAG TPA: 4Fe-4S dicluster domain-containing protein [Thermoplasmatales archaeon]|nr:4Fe-4S dicluster domain-containing protein [Thermoplasmatales archaeon]